MELCGQQACHHKCLSGIGSFLRCCFQDYALASSPIAQVCRFCRRSTCGGTFASSGRPLLSLKAAATDGEFSLAPSLGHLPGRLYPRGTLALFGLSKDQVENPVEARNEIDDRSPGAGSSADASNRGVARKQKGSTIFDPHEQFRAHRDFCFGLATFLIAAR